MNKLLESVKAPETFLDLRISDTCNVSTSAPGNR